uniref:HAD family phosphatase n=1 Tax=Parastrongyloides trichosuri TaxID=131310 RepID=A0A0N4Z8T9_PARTI
MENENRKYKIFMFDMGGVILKYNNAETIYRVQKPDENVKKVMEDMDIGKETVESVGNSLDESHSLKKFFTEVLTHRDITLSFGGLSEDPKFIKCLRVLKENGYKVALLTNNYFYDNTRSDSVIMNNLSYFDYVVESCRIGLRKPDEGYFQYALNLTQCKPDECVFVDDLKINCEGAENVGIKAIHLKDCDSETAIKEIELITKLCIL